MKYIKKPVVIEAECWNGPETMNDRNSLFYDSRVVIDYSGLVFMVDTLEGQMKGSKGDYLIKGIKGELYPCKPDIFEATYEKVVELKDKPTIEELEKILAGNPNDYSIRVNPDGSITSVKFGSVI